MGNIPNGGSVGTKIGKSASVFVTRRDGNGYFGVEPYKEHSATFRVDGRTSTSSIRMFKRPGCNNRFVIKMTDSGEKLKSLRFWPYRFEMVVETTQDQQHLKVVNQVIQHDLFNPMKTIAGDDGTVTLTYLNLYTVQGSDKQKGLLVIEVKKRSVEHSPFAVFVSHYFAGMGKTSAGFSVVAKLRGGGGGDDEDGLQFEKPIIHPASDLFEMFDKVSKNDHHWSPNACPHCAANSNKSTQSDTSVIATKGRRDMRIQNKPKGGGLRSLFMDRPGDDYILGKLQISESESESEDSDGDGDSQATTREAESTTKHHRHVVVKKNFGIIVQQ